MLPLQREMRDLNRYMSSNEDVDIAREAACRHNEPAVNVLLTGFLGLCAFHSDELDAINKVWAR